MNGVLENLKKLRGRSLREVRVRGGQGLAVLCERMLGLSEMRDDQLFRAIHPASRNGSGEGTAALIIERIKASGAQTFFPSFAHRTEVVALMERRFPEQRRALLSKAEQIMAGKFDLLGFSGLEFGNPIDWHLEPVSGKSTPLVHWSQIDYLNANTAGDKKIIWELNRHQFFVTLGQAYWLTGDEKYAEAFVALVTSWMGANPVGRGINWASSLEVAFRAISWVWALHLFAGSAHVTPKFAARLLKCLMAHGRHIETYLSHYFSPNTHLTGEALGLFYLGTALPELRSAGRWQAVGLKILQEQLSAQIRRDGVYFEQASYYHRYTADFYTHLLVLARAARVNLSAEVKQKLTQMLDHLMWITRPDGTSPLIGDDDGGRLVFLGVRPANDFRDTLAAGAALTERGDWKFMAGTAAAETLWLLGPEGLTQYDQIEAELPRQQGHAFAESGYFVMRDGWSPDSGYVLVDCGPHGELACGHAHADALALEFAAAGVMWLVDPGTYTYTGSAEWRDQFRTTAGHNTVVVDGQSQSVPAGPFSWSHIAESRASEFVATESFGYFEGSHNGYQRLDDPVTHTRSVLLMKSTPESQLFPYLVVRDNFNAHAHHRYEMHYHFSAGCKATAQGNQVEVTKPRIGDLAITAFGTAELRTKVEQGWVSHCYGQCQPAPVATIMADGNGTQEFATIITPSVPWGPTRAVEAISLRGADGGGAAVSLDGLARRNFFRRCEGGFSVVSGNSLDVVLVGDQGNRLSSKSLSAEAEMAWSRWVDGRPARAGLIRGRALEVKGHLGFKTESMITYCSIEFQKSCLEIGLRGATRFDLTFHQPADRVVINGLSLDLNPGMHSAVFEDDGSGWQLRLTQFGGI
jgi:hypothetical protein